MRKEASTSILDDSVVSRWAGPAVCIFLVVVAMMRDATVIGATTGYILSLLSMLGGVAWAVQGPEKLRRLSELYYGSCSFCH